MKKTFKNLLLAVFLINIFFTTKVFAELSPTFETLSAVIGEDSVSLRGDFNSHNNNYFPTKQPYVWFEYGTNPYDLAKKTIEVAKNKGNYIVSHFVYGLEKDTTYYYRAAMRFDSKTSYGKTLSFVNINEASEKQGLVSTTATTTTEPKKELPKFLTPEEQYQQYIDATTPSAKGSDSPGSSVKGSTIQNNKPFSFWDIFSWGNKDSETSQSSNNVLSDEEIAAEQKKREDLLATQEKNNKSAAHDDELGEIVKYNTNYKNTYKNSESGFAQKSQKEPTLNYGILLLFILFFIVAIFLVRIILRRRQDGLQKNIDHLRKTTGNESGESRYSIPVHRDLADQKYNPNQAFFRKPPQK